MTTPCCHKGWLPFDLEIVAEDSSVMSFRRVVFAVGQFVETNFPDLRNEQKDRTMKLLLADDSGTMRTIQKRCLLKLGLAETDITEAEDGQQALTQFEGGTFDVVLSDWNMPNMDGLTFLQKVREINKDVPFIMITTEAERARVVTAIQAGVTDYLVKPFTPDDLRAKLEKWVAAPV